MLSKYFSSLLFFMLTLLPISSNAKMDINKYSQPVVITKLEWILLDTRIGLSSISKFDDYGLINGIDFFANDKDPAIRVLFYLNKSPYLRMENHVIEKVLTDKMNYIVGIIKLQIREADIKEDFIANFHVIDGKEIGRFENGIFRFLK